MGGGRRASAGRRVGLPPLDRASIPPLESGPIAPGGARSRRRSHPAPTGGRGLGWGRGAQDRRGGMRRGPGSARSAPGAAQPRRRRCRARGTPRRGRRMPRPQGSRRAPGARGAGRWRGACRPRSADQHAPCHRPPRWGQGACGRAQRAAGRSGGPEAAAAAGAASAGASGPRWTRAAASRRGMCREAWPVPGRSFALARAMRNMPCRRRARHVSRRRARTRARARAPWKAGTMRADRQRGGPTRPPLGRPPTSGRSATRA